MPGVPEILPPATDLVPDGERRPPSASPLALRPFPVDDPLYETARSATEFIGAAKADATHRAYDSDWRDFEAWCRGHGLSFLPAQPETVALYLSALARPSNGDKPRKPSTLTRRLTAIAA
ncbi:MAG: hypothetical protein ACYCTE_03190, partial [Acidimicrobiales bacterium]